MWLEGAHPGGGLSKWLREATLQHIPLHPSPATFSVGLRLIQSGVSSGLLGTFFPAELKKGASSLRVSGSHLGALRGVRVRVNLISQNTEQRRQKQTSLIHQSLDTEATLPAEFLAKKYALTNSLYSLSFY